MISERKKYIIKLFLKKCTLQSINKAHMDFSLQLFKNSYPNVPDEKVKELRKRYNLDEYINRLIPILDKQFTIEELQETIKFYSSATGRKLLDPNYLYEIGELGTRMFKEIEQEFAISNINDIKKNKIK